METNNNTLSKEELEVIINVNEQIDEDTMQEEIEQEDFDEQIQLDDEEMIKHNGEELFKALGKYLNFAA